MTDLNSFTDQFYRFYPIAEELIENIKTGSYDMKKNIAQLIGLEKEYEELAENFFPNNEVLKKIDDTPYSLETKEQREIASRELKDQLERFYFFNHHFRTEIDIEENGYYGDEINIRKLFAKDETELNIFDNLPNDIGISIPSYLNNHALQDFYNKHNENINKTLKYFSQTIDGSVIKEIWEHEWLYKGLPIMAYHGFINPDQDMLLYKGMFTKTAILFFLISHMSEELLLDKEEIRKRYYQKVDHLILFEKTRKTPLHSAIKRHCDGYNQEREEQEIANNQYALSRDPKKYYGIECLSRQPYFEPEEGEKEYFDVIELEEEPYIWNKHIPKIKNYDSWLTIYG